MYFSKFYNINIIYINEGGTKKKIYFYISSRDFDFVSLVVYVSKEPADLNIICVCMYVRVTSIRVSQPFSSPPVSDISLASYSIIM